jgi:hypothetical protein
VPPVATTVGRPMMGSSRMRRMSTAIAGSGEVEPNREMF